MLKTFLKHCENTTFLYGTSKQGGTKRKVTFGLWFVEEPLPVPPPWAQGPQEED